MPSAPTTSPSEAGGTVRFGHLDALRGIAILGVLFVHSAEAAGVQGRAALLASIGVRGVQLFYMVSAYTLLLSMESRRLESHSLLKFYLRRFFRIAPLFYVVLFLTWLIRVISPQKINPSPTIDYLLGILFLFGFKMSAMNSIVGGGWSVAVETTFYAVLPLLRKIVRGVRDAATAYVLLLLVVTPLSYWLARPAYSDRWAYYELLWFPIELPIFLLGMLLFHLLRLGTPESPKLWSLCSLTAGLALVGLNHTLALPVFMGRLPLDGLAVALFFLAVVWHPWALMVNRATLLLGTVSYSLYLLHMVIMPLGGGLLLRYVIGTATTTTVTLLYFVVLIIVAVPLSLLSYRWIEQPGVLLGRRLIDRIEHRATRLTVASVPSVASQLDTGDGQF